MDMSQLNKDTPAQARERLQWILDVVRENQMEVAFFLQAVTFGNYEAAKRGLSKMHKNDRDALLQPNGILTDEQIELLK